VDKVATSYPLTSEAWVHSQTRLKVDKVATGLVFLWVFWFSLVRTIPPMLHTHSFTTDTDTMWS